MEVLKTVYVGRVVVLNGQDVTVIGETDSGNLKVQFADGHEEWTSYTKVLAA